VHDTSLQVVQLSCEGCCSNRMGASGRSRVNDEQNIKTAALLPGDQAPIKAEAQVPNPPNLLALWIQREWTLEAAAARSRTQAPGTADPVTKCRPQLSGS
jgi:hypothetical protein